jgi:hypothetical protein
MFRAINIYIAYQSQWFPRAQTLQFKQILIGSCVLKNPAQSLWSSFLNVSKYVNTRVRWITKNKYTVLFLNKHTLYRYKTRWKIENIFLARNRINREFETINIILPSPSRFHNLSFIKNFPYRNAMYILCCFPTVTHFKPIATTHTSLPGCELHKLRSSLLGLYNIIHLSLFEVKLLWARFRFAALRNSVTEVT